ncbi:MAG: recombinase RecT [Oscillospiraceae bacterium]
MNNSNLSQTSQKPKFSIAITTPGYQKLINNTLGDPDRAKRFIATITSSVAVNPALQDCEAGTILAAALLGESLNLSPSPQLGQFYLVPFNDKKSGLKKAQFILGYKGYIQLAIRSGQYTKLNVLEIKEGELKHFDPLNETIECMLIDDWDEREAAPTIGYYAMFEYVNGFRKAIYWSRKKMMTHADKFSPSFSAEAYQNILDGKIADKDMWKYSSFWYKSFDDMAKKTMLRQLISHWSAMSTEMQSAFGRDSSLVEVGEDNSFVTTPEDGLQIAQAEATEVVEKVDLDEL